MQHEQLSLMGKTRIPGNLDVHQTRGGKAGIYLGGTGVAACDPCPSRRALLEKELESVGIRLNKEKPNIYFKVRGGGSPQVGAQRSELLSCMQMLGRIGHKQMGLCLVCQPGVISVQIMAC